MKRKLLFVSLLSALTLVGCGPKENTSKPTDSGSSNSGTSQPTPSSPTTPEVKVKTCAELNSLLAENKAGTDEYKVSGTVTGIIGSAFYIQDSTGGFYIYKPVSMEGVAVGKKVEVVSTITTYNGVYETEQGKAKVSVVSDSTDSYSPVEYTSISDMTQLKQSTLAKVSGLKWQSNGAYTNSKGQNASYSITTKLGENTLDLRVDYNNTNWQAITDKAKTLKANDTINLNKAVLSWYSKDSTNNPQLNILSADDFEIVSGQQAPEVAITGVSLTTGSGFTEKAAEDRYLVLNEELQVTAKVAPKNATDTITWTSSDATVASVSNTGKVKGLKAGEATIKAAASYDNTKFAQFKVTVDTLENVKTAIKNMIDNYRKDEVDKLTDDEKTKITTSATSYKNSIDSENTKTSEGCYSNLDFQKKAVDLAIFKSNFNALGSNYFTEKKTFYAEFYLELFGAGLITWEIEMNTDGTISGNQTFVLMPGSDGNPTKQPLTGSYKLSNAYSTSDNNKISFLIGDDQYGYEIDLNWVNHNLEFDYQAQNGIVKISTVKPVYTNQLGTRNPFKDEKVTFTGVQPAAHITTPFVMDLPEQEHTLVFEYNNKVTDTMVSSGTTSVYKGYYNLVVDATTNKTTLKWKLANSNQEFDWMTATEKPDCEIITDATSKLRSFSVDLGAGAFTLTEVK